MSTLEDFIAAVRIWQTQRVEVFSRQPYGDGSNAKSLREFTEIQNGVTRRLVSLTGIQEPDFWTALQELAGNTDRVIRGGKTFVNGQDVTTQTTGESV